jgi:5-methylcytosine-specific restriction enzyme subunit McrC
MSYLILHNVNQLLSRGLQRQYMHREENLLSPRGRIAISQIANRGGLIQNSLPCAYYLRLDDCLLNQVLLQGTHLGTQLTSNEKLCLKLQHLERSQLSGISSRRLTRTILQRAQREISRLTASYIPALKLIELLFSSAGLSLDGEQPTTTLPGFLFDMNRFFQDLLSRFLREHLPDYEFQDQYVLDNMMIYAENPRHRQAPSLRPDYVVKSQGKIVAILDAKYRDLWEKDLPTHMLYQLIMYAIGQDACDCVTILYPTTDSSAKKARIEVSIPLSQKGSVSVMLCPVNLLYLDKLLSKTNLINNAHERRDFAKQLLGKY